MSETLPPGYRQGFITAITVIITASVLYFRYQAFEPAGGPWKPVYVWSALLTALSICVQLVVLWRSLQPEDEKVIVYRNSVRIFAVAVAILFLALVVNTIGSLDLDVLQLVCRGR